MHSWWRRIFFLNLGLLLYASLTFASPSLADLKVKAPDYGFLDNNALATDKSPKIATWITISAYAGTAILVPAMTLLGALIANPQWSVVGDMASPRTKISYIDHTTSGATIPVTALFAFLGTAPLLGLFMSESWQ